MILGILTVPALAGTLGTSSSHPPFVTAHKSPGPLPGFDWPTYLGNTTRESESPETILSPTNVANLTPIWGYHTGGSVVTNPAVANGIVFAGSWDGFEYALDFTNGTPLWRTFTGTTRECGWLQGVTSSATVAGGFVYLGGGNDSWYALNARNGTRAWSVFTGSSAAVTGGHYNWASPLLFGGSAYIGLASGCDRPLIQGGLLEVNLTRHSVTHIFHTTPNGTVGSSIWGSPSVDPVSQTVYVPTGNAGISLIQR